VDEPTTNADGSALTDLATVRFYFKHADGSDWVPPVDVPASASTGGGQHTTVLTTTIPDGQVETGMAQATAVDTSGNESAVIQQPVLVDAQSPSAPVNMTVTTVVQ
jgi:hypothetical protein